MRDDGRRNYDASGWRPRAPPRPLRADSLGCGCGGLGTLGIGIVTVCDELLNCAASSTKAGVYECARSALIIMRKTLSSWRYLL